MNITDIVKYSTDTGTEIELSAETVRTYLIRGAEGVTDQEVVMFIEVCKAHRLNPFLNEAYLIKYGDYPASIVMGKETFTKRAERHSNFDGFEAGVTVLTPDGKKIVRRNGGLVLEGERLVGGWARIHRKDRKAPSYDEVKFEEYAKTSSGNNNNWSKMPGTMIRKVALVHALREAFPEAFSGLYSPEELAVETDALGIPQEREPIQAEVVEELIVNEHDYTRLTELKEIFAQAMGWDLEEAARAIVRDFGEPRGMDDAEYAAMLERLEKTMTDSGMLDIPSPEVPATEASLEFLPEDEEF